mmetsp:Transcript_134037/g.387930  ORF Transcript_134037/g.387930 Transcript_134037/m.387930 type:complete len:549 (-) Transcript_134037:307-1953(-)
MGDERRHTYALALHDGPLDVLGDELPGFPGGARAALHLASLDLCELEGVRADSGDVDVGLPVHQVAVHGPGQVRPQDRGELALCGVAHRVEVAGLDKAGKARLHLNLAILAQLDVGNVVVVRHGGDGSHDDRLPEKAADVRRIAVLHVPPEGMVLGELEHADRVEGMRLRRVSLRHTAREQCHPAHRGQVVRIFRTIDAGQQRGAQHRHAPRGVGVEKLAGLVAAVAGEGVLQRQLVQDALAAETDIHHRRAGGRPLRQREAPRAPRHAPVRLDGPRLLRLRRRALGHVPNAGARIERADADLAPRMVGHELGRARVGPLATEVDAEHGPCCRIRRSCVDFHQQRNGVQPCGLDAGVRRKELEDEHVGTVPLRAQSVIPVEVSDGALALIVPVQLREDWAERFGQQGSHASQRRVQQRFGEPIVRVRLSGPPREGHGSGGADHLCRGAWGNAAVDEGAHLVLLDVTSAHRRHAREALRSRTPALDVGDGLVLQRNEQLHGRRAGEPDAVRRGVACAGGAVLSGKPARHRLHLVCRQLAERVLRGSLAE